ncbi:MAG: CAP domain-containing protein [Spirochaetaceae bacterium]|nr:CAP domain-containing protein [Spirochaetaceae bacterium]MCF7947629.1 CAP domain-containing protein [Spirochaetia bacterium]MCF7951763.1 CAP domain-containing protein [Spirochaetaceae bacterium]
MSKAKVRVPLILCISTLFLLGSCTSLIEGLKESSIQRTAPQETQPEKTPSTVVETQAPALKSELAAAEQEILRLVNQQRDEHNLPRLYLSTELSQVARDHSTDMAKRNFYSHIDPQGTTPHQRITRKMGDRYYLEGTAENIAYSERSDGFSSLSQQQIGRDFMHGWMNSPGHRANILREGMTHIGIGLHQQGNRIYATQKFIGYIARLTGTADKTTLSLEQPVIQLALNSHRMTKDKLTVMVGLPDKNAKWPTPDGSYYRGLGYVKPLWTKEHEFTIELPVATYGKGTYTIQLGAQGNRSVGQKQFTFYVN